MITAKIIKDSVSKHGKRLTTFELEYPRFIHSEFMTHRMLSRNAASSRAIPLQTMIKLVWNNPAEPVSWGKNQSGMQAKEDLRGFPLKSAKFIWNVTGKIVCIFAWILGRTKVHKQIANRILEPWSHIKVVASSTDWDNFFYLRNHPDAQPEIHELARIMWDLYSNNKPNILNLGEWHLPYVDGYNIMPDSEFVPFHELDISLTDAIKLSASLCAQVSYRKSDESVEKALRIYERLVHSKPAHASPFEHQATPSKNLDRISGNFRGWLQFRQQIPGNVCKKYINK